MVRLSSGLWECSPAGSLRGLVLAHWCPGCQRVHMIAVEKPDDRGALWVWDRRRFRPTIVPSIDMSNGRCLYYIRDGRLEFTTLSKHEFAGIIMPIPDWNERRRGERK